MRYNNSVEPGKIVVIPHKRIRISGTVLEAW